MKTLKEKLLHTATGKQWDRVGIQSHQGIMVPLFSIHTALSCGIGEFLDLLPLIDLCARWGLDLLQILPLNNEESEPSPYNCISSCALNPIYLSLHALPHLDSLEELRQKLPPLERLTNIDRVDYSEVATHKGAFLKKYYEAVGEKILETDAAQAFIKNQKWLKPYALFRALKKQYNDAPWEVWDLENRCLNKAQLEHLYPLYEEEISLHCLLQYLCFIQLKRVKTYAEKAGILLMGDLPILLSKESADVWQHIELFNVHLSAGAPPDSYNLNGQNWGFPLFNWDALRKEDFLWWKERLLFAENFYDLFRLDHILGFFRFFAIPPNHPSAEGRYIPDNDTACEAQGIELLSMVASNTSMLPIGEDLGTALPLVRPCLENLGICGTRVMHWERRQDKEKSYISPQEFSPISLTCVSTHDSEPLALWWKERTEEALAFAKMKGWDYTTQLSSQQREEILWDSHHSASLFHVNSLTEYLAFFPDLIHASEEEERINTPGTYSPKNWSYRMIPSLEELLKHEGLLNVFKCLVQKQTKT